MRGTGFGGRRVCTRGVSARRVGLAVGRPRDVEKEPNKSQRESSRGKKRWESEVEGEGGKDKQVVISADDGMIRGVVY